jgi:hypothetical protein
MGMVQSYEVACTTDKDTTGVIEKKGCPFGTAYNESATAVTVTWHAARTKAGTRLPLYDQEGVPVVQTVPAGGSVEVNTSLAGASFVFPKVSSAVTLYFEFTKYPD